MSDSSAPTGESRTKTAWSKNLPPLVKGVPAAEIIALWRKGHSHNYVQRRHPQLTWADIDDAVNAARYAQVQGGLAEGKTTIQLAKELRVSPAAVWAIKKRAERNAIHRRDWGGLSPRAVTFLRKRFGYKSLAEVQKDPPTEEKLFWTKGVGLYLFNEVRNVVPLKPGEHPVEVISRTSPASRPAPRPVSPGRQRAPVYVTKAAHYQEALDSPSAPKSATEFAHFLAAVVKFAGMVPLDETLPSDIPCMAGPAPSRWCLGVVDVWWSTSPSGVCWECPVCHKRGIVTDVGGAPAPPISPDPGGPLH